MAHPRRWRDGRQHDHHVVGQGTLRLSARLRLQVNRGELEGDVALMGWFVSEDRVPVELEGCRCPGSPHDHDTVWLRAELGPEAGFAAVAAVDRIVAEARASGAEIMDFAE